MTLVFKRFVRGLRVVTVGHFASLARLGGETDMPAISSISIRISSNANTSSPTFCCDDVGGVNAEPFVAEKVKPPGPTTSLVVSAGSGVEVPDVVGVPSGVEKLNLRFQARVAAGERFELGLGARGVLRRGVGWPDEPGGVEGDLTGGELRAKLKVEEEGPDIALLSGVHAVRLDVTVICVSPSSACSPE